MTNKDNKTLSEAIEYNLDKFFEMHAGDCPESGLYDRVINEVEKVLIKRTLNHVGGVQVKASKILGINRNTLRKKMHNLKIS
jgi:DNA-binding protein Fis